MITPEKEEKLENTINLNFFIQDMRVENRSTTYHKLYIRIKDLEDENETNYEFIYLKMEEIDVREILDKISRLYDMKNIAVSETLMKGIKEELLRLISLLIYDLL
ncbi:hypothetical protein [Saccharolobus solfataricus]|uniref:hypothetical protein n=1 Tax=Saccharolobus solfataricus TaxID=2287 RepID=UPI0001C3955A